jgi:hypothetical protein
MQKIIISGIVAALVSGSALATKPDFPNGHDNRPENLELWTKPQLAGQRVEDLVAWVIRHYPEQVKEALTL